MPGESEFIAALRALAVDPAARGLLDDAAVLDVAGTRLVLTHDMLVEGVHFLPSDPPESVAWKLVAVNLSDLAAKGARPLGVLLGYCLRGEAEWDRAFVAGLREVLEQLSVPLLGGDTIALPPAAPAAFGLTAIGTADTAPSRSGARIGDLVWVSGTIGDAGAGLEVARQGGPAALLDRYRRPQPRLEAGLRLAAHVTAMMDVSDGLLIDAQKLGDAGSVGLALDIGSIPLSSDYVAFRGEGEAARLAAATAGDDYELLFTAPLEARAAILSLAAELTLPLTAIGHVVAGSGLSIHGAGGPLLLPESLGYEHGAVPIQE